MIAVLQGKKTELLPVVVQIKNQNITDFSRTYNMDNTHSLVLTKQGSKYSLESTGVASWSVFTYKFSRDAKEDNKTSETALYFANAMSTQNFEGLADYANDNMKGFLGSEEGTNQLKEMWAYYIKQAGAFKSYNIYKTEGELGSKTVHIRFHFEKEDVGFVIAINSKNLIQGMFNDNDIRTSAIQKVKLTPINENEFFINGHQNDGMQDLKIKVSKKGLILIDGNMSFKATIKPSF